MRYEAHSIRGSAQQMGAMELSEHCQELESHAISSPASILKKAVDRVELSFQRASGSMSLYLEDFAAIERKQALTRIADELYARFRRFP